MILHAPGTAGWVGSILFPDGVPDPARFSPAFLLARRPSFASWASFVTGHALASLGDVGVLGAGVVAART